MQEIVNSLKSAVKTLEELKQWKKEKGEIEDTFYHCYKCNDVSATFHIDENGYKIAAMCDCYYSKKLEQSKEADGISKLFKTKTLQNFKPQSDEQREALAIAEKYVINFGSESLAFYGRVGAGKTHLAVGVAVELEKKGHRLKFYDYPTLMTELESLKYDSTGFRDLIGKIQNYDVLVIDDLFKTGWREWNSKKTIIANHKEYIYKIINHRMVNKKPVIVTTEFPIDEFFDFEEAITSRILGMAGDNYYNFVAQTNLRTEFGE